MEARDLTEKRKAGKLSLDKMAAKMGVSPSFLIRIERGQRVALRLVTCDRLAQAYGVAPEEMQRIIDGAREGRG